MLRRKYLTGAVLFIAAAAIGCEQTMTGLGGKNSPEMPIGESHFLKVLANANQQEQEMGKIILNRSTNQQVRQFAQTEIDEHTQMQDQLNSLAQSKGAELPRVLGNMEQGTVNDLASQPANLLDKTYIDHEVAAHQDAINTTNAEAMNGADLDLKNFAQKWLPPLQQHLVKAKELQQTVK